MTDISGDLEGYTVGIITASSGELAMSGKRSRLKGLISFARPHESVVPRIRFVALALIVGAVELYLVDVVFEFTFGNGPWHV